MENITSANEGIIARKKPSIMAQIKSKLSQFDDLTGKQEKGIKKEKTFIEKNKAYIIIAIAVISTIITVKVTFNSLASSPVPTISEDEALSIITDLYSTVWEIDRGHNLLPSELKNQTYVKIEFTNHIIQDGLTIPIKLSTNNLDNILGVEIGYVSFNRTQEILIATLPNTETLKFLYTAASTTDMENITLVGDDNNRCYFTKKEIQK
jgi:hypothetical protein